MTKIVENDIDQLLISYRSSKRKHLFKLSSYIHFNCRSFYVMPKRAKMMKSHMFVKCVICIFNDSNYKINLLTRLMCPFEIFCGIVFLSNPFFAFFTLLPFIFTIALFYRIFINFINSSFVLFERTLAIGKGIC